MVQGTVTKQSVSAHAYRDCVTVGEDSFQALQKALSGMNAPHLEKEDYLSSYGILCAMSGSSSSSTTSSENWVTVQKDTNLKGSSVGCSGLHRATLHLRLDDVVTLQPRVPPMQAYLQSIKFSLNTLGKLKNPRTVDATELQNAIRQNFVRHPFCVGHEVALQFEGVKYKLKCTNLEFATVGDRSAEESATTSKDTTTTTSTNGILTQNSDCFFVKSPEVKGIRIKGATSAPSSAGEGLRKMDFLQMGIGGLGKQFATIFRRAFASRVFPPDVVKAMGIEHVRGLLLYGPPGCGKTLIARKIGRMLNAREPKIVNGPEVKSKFVGESEENIRKLFADAEKEQQEAGDESELHIIIFDEIDAICKARGAQSDNTGTDASIVNQLLSKMDGVDSLNNILVIAMTNRKDMLDPALLRPGRFEIHIEIGLPDEAGRVQILTIHTENMRKGGILGSGVSIPYLASETKNFSGAECAALVKSAASHAFNRQLNMKDPTKPINPKEIKVVKEDFDHALHEIQPSFGAKEDQLVNCYRQGIIDYGPSFGGLFQSVTDFVTQVRRSSRTSLFSLLLTGPPGCGKTALAARIARDSEFPFVQMIAADQMIGFSENAKCSKIKTVFLDAYKSPLSIIILDDIERILDYVSIGGSVRFSNAVLQALLVMIKKNPTEDGRKLIIIGTSACADELQTMGITSSFNVVKKVPMVTSAVEISHVLQEVGNVQQLDEEMISAHVTQPIGIKHLLMVLEMARDDTGSVSAERFVKVYNECML